MLPSRSGSMMSSGHVSDSNAMGLSCSNRIISTSYQRSSCSCVWAQAGKVIKVRNRVFNARFINNFDRVKMVVFN